jgi:hypothetical protein
LTTPMPAPWRMLLRATPTSLMLTSETTNLASPSRGRSTT